MPVAFLLECVCTTPEGLSSRELRGRALQGAFLEAVRRVDPQIAEELHEGNAGKPYTLSLMKRPHGTQIRQFSLRITLLNDRHFALLLKLQGATSTAPLPLGHKDISIQSVHLDAGPHRSWSGFATWAMLKANAATGSLLKFELATPICFKQADKETGRSIEMPLPLPNLLLGSALRAWNQWSELPMGQELHEQLSTHLEITCPTELETYEMEFAFGQTTRKIVGSVGEISYRIHSNTAPELQLQLNVLADVLKFTGAGQRTTLGMGRVRRI